MEIAIIGLGLIGGSIARAMQKYTPHTVLGLDTDEQVLYKARLLDAIDAEKIKKGSERLEFEKSTGKTRGYRMFRTLADVEAGRTILDEDDLSVVTEEKADPLGADIL